MGHAFFFSNFINGHSINVVHPKSAELCFRQLVPDLRNHRGSHSAPLRFLVLALHNPVSYTHLDVYKRQVESAVGVLESSVTMEQGMRVRIGFHSLIKGLENQRIVVAFAEHIGHCLLYTSRCV